jgi:hypothetical protein
LRHDLSCSTKYSTFAAIIRHGRDIFSNHPVTWHNG